MPKISKITLTTDALLAEIRRRRNRLPKLRRLAARLESKLAAVRADIASLGGDAKVAVARPKATGRKRPKNKITLAAAIVKVLSKDAPKSVPEIARAVRKAGYRSVSRTFHTIIYQTLAKEKQVKKAARGRYVLKG